MGHDDVVWYFEKRVEGKKGRKSSIYKSDRMERSILSGR